MLGFVPCSALEIFELLARVNERLCASVLHIQQSGVNWSVCPLGAQCFGVPGFRAVGALPEHLMYFEHCRVLPWPNARCELNIETEAKCKENVSSRIHWSGWSIPRFTYRCFQNPSHKSVGESVVKSVFDLFVLSAAIRVLIHNTDIDHQKQQKPTVKKPTNEHPLESQLESKAGNSSQNDFIRLEFKPFFNTWLCV
eukprot:6464686-Amphidinium_carterae.1